MRSFQPQILQHFLVPLVIENVSAIIFSFNISYPVSIVPDFMYLSNENMHLDRDLGK